MQQCIGAMMLIGGVWILATELPTYFSQADLIRKKEDDLEGQLSAVMKNFAKENTVYRRRAEYYYYHEFRRQRNTLTFIKVHRRDDLMDVKDIMDHEVYNKYHVDGSNKN